MKINLESVSRIDPAERKRYKILEQVKKHLVNVSYNWWELYMHLPAHTGETEYLLDESKISEAFEASHSEAIMQIPHTLGRRDCAIELLDQINKWEKEYE